MRRVLIVAGIVVVAALVALVVYLLAFRDTATPVDPTDLRGAEVYPYLTTGYEEIDALSGARHDYPALTYLLVTDGSCGPVVRWEALAERWVEWEHCGPDDAATGTRSYHEWFGVPDLEVEVCPEPMPLVPSDVVTVACVTGDTTETYTITPMGSKAILLGGEEVVVDHVVVTSVLTGGTTGGSRVDLWVLPGTVLVVRTEVDRHTVSPSRVGDVRYDEVYTLVMESPPVSP